MNTIEETLKAFKRGEMIILVDDEDRENEGDLVIAADKITPEAINFMATHGRGLICLAMSNELVDQLQLPMMTSRNQSAFGTAFTVSIEATKGVTTGISSADRAHTIKVAVSKNAKPDDVITPGHVFPLRARAGGVLERAGQTEGSVDLARLAGLRPAGVICEIMKPDGTMARMTDLKKFAKKYKLRIAAIRDLIAYRFKTENLIKKTSSAKLPVQLANGTNTEFKVIGFENLIDHTEVIALVKGTLKGKPLVRVHSECLTGDVLGSERCDCGDQLKSSLIQINEQGGLLLYVCSQEGRGIGILNKINAYALQDQGYDTVQANQALGFKPDHRQYGIAAQIIQSLGIKQLRLLTNNPKKIEELVAFGLNVTRAPLVIDPKKNNSAYLKTKQKKMGHLLNL